MNLVYGRSLRAVLSGIAVGFGAACASSGAGSALRAAHSGRTFERAVIPAMTTVHAVAANDQYLFVATTGALGVYDRRFNGWLPPFSRLDGWPGVTVDAMLADPFDRGTVWIVDGNVVYRYRVGFEGVVRALVPSRVPGPGSIFVDGGDPGGGLVVRTGSTQRRDASGTTTVNTYVRVTPTGIVEPLDARRVEPQIVGRDARGRPVYAARPPRYSPETPEQIFERFPAIRGFERLLTQDASLNTWPITSAAAAPNESLVWLGTIGGGVFNVDPLFNRGSQMPYGLLAEGAGAVALGADGVWVGGAGVQGSARDGLTFVDNALSSWRWVDGGIGSPFRGARVTDLSVFGSLVWAATTRGVVVINGQTGDVVRRWDALSGLPGDAVLAVEATRDGAWVGTTSGLAFITEDGEGRGGARASAVGSVFAEGRTVHGLARRGDTLWVASDIGILALPAGDSTPRRLRAVDADSRLGRRILAVAIADTTIVAATDAGDVLRVNMRTGAPLDPVSFTPAGRIGTVNAVAIDSLTIWVAGPGGVIAVDRATRRERYLVANRDVPGDVLDVALTPGAAWIATHQGLVRLERLADGLVR